MDIEIFNDLLIFLQLDFEVIYEFKKSGQRIVYKSRCRQDSTFTYVLKTSPVLPMSVARLQRELKILDELKTQFFPKSIGSHFVSEEDIKFFIDHLHPKKDQEKIQKIKKAQLRPFFITIENYIDHLDWEHCRQYFSSDETRYAKLMGQIFYGLDQLWTKKIIHRDLKPDNILISPNYDPTIIDLGIAQSLNDGTIQITQPFQFSPCTPQFAAPEQLLNKKNEISFKSDQFAMGVLSYWIFTNDYPFGNIQEIGYEAFLGNIATGGLKSFADNNISVSEATQDFILKLLNIKPYQRFRKYSSIVNSLNKIGESN